jgi:hypothetical protein
MLGRWDSWNQLPDMDMISFGPTIRGAHSPDERASISHRKILEIFARFREYSSEIVSSCQSYFQVVTDLRIIILFNLKKRQNENYFSFCLFLLFTAINCTNFNKFLLIELIDENQ